MIMIIINIFEGFRCFRGVAPRMDERMLWVRERTGLCVCVHYTRV